MKLHKGHLGPHLFDRASGLNILLDEVSVGEDQWSVAPKYVSIALTNACELSCGYCYAPKTSARLTYDSVVNWAKELDSHGCLGIGFGGGEPTLYPHFADLCREIHDCTELAVTFTTHGHRLSQELSAKLSGKVQFIRLSMDGIGSTYERLRGRPFQEFCNKLAIARDTSSFGINFVLNDDTAGELEQAADFAFSQGAFEFLVLPQLGQDETPEVSPQVIADAQQWMSANYRRYRIACSSRGADYFDVPKLPIFDPQYTDRDFLHIDAQGRIKKSAFSGCGVLISDFANLSRAIESLRLGAEVN